MFIAPLLALAVLVPDPGTPKLWEQEAPATNWARTPDPEVTSDLMPGFAAQLDLRGWAIVRCYQETDGHPYNCRVVEERPQGLGFGSAARVVVASGELRLGRVAGIPMPGEVQARVRFRVEDEADEGGWSGPEPSEIQLKLARQIVDRAYEDGEPEEDNFLDGLDYDRRAVVQAWVDELFVEVRAERREALVLQLARLASESDLRRLLAGDYVSPPDMDRFESAYPESKAAKAAVAELRRRYCERYSCDASEVKTDGRSDGR